MERRPVTGDILYADTDAGRKLRIVAISSEAALFEYASDDDVVANLQALCGHTPADAVAVGSVTSDSDVARVSRRGSRVPLQPRSVAHFGSPCERAGWTIDRVIDRPTCRDVRLVKA